jgi:GH24 family phage-related lysozyme (muramidase)
MKSGLLFLSVLIVFVSLVSGQEISGFGGGEIFIRGDANDDGVIAMDDAIKILDVLFLGRGELNCKDSADTNDDGRVDITDALFLLEFLFLGEAAPPTPFEVAGFDLTLDSELCGDEWAQGDLSEVVLAMLPIFFGLDEGSISSDSEIETLYSDIGFNNGEFQSGSLLDQYCLFIDGYCEFGTSKIESAIAHEILEGTTTEDPLLTLTNCNSQDNACMRSVGIDIILILFAFMLAENDCAEIVANTQLTDKGKCALKVREGKPGGVGVPDLSVHDDGAGNPTVGWGHKVTGSDNLNENDEITLDSAKDLFEKDVKDAEKKLRRHIPNGVIKKFTQDQYDAMVSFFFNIGNGRKPPFSESNAKKAFDSCNLDGGFEETLDPINGWTNGGEDTGVANRRRSERKQAKTGDISIFDGVVETPVSEEDCNNIS